MIYANDKCIVKSNVDGLMNKQLTEEWMILLLAVFAFGRWVPSWDSFCCHISDSVRDKLKAFYVDAVVVPGGCTKYI